MKNRKRRGMSLVEVMVTIAIILTLMSIMAYGVFSVFAASQESTTLLTLGKVGQQVEVYRLQRGRPPSTAEGLGVLSGKIPNDSWGRSLFYLSPGPGGAPYAIGSYGADGAEGGDDDLLWTSEGQAGG